MVLVAGINDSKGWQDSSPWKELVAAKGHRAVDDMLRTHTGWSLCQLSSASVSILSSILQFLNTEHWLLGSRDEDLLKHIGFLDASQSIMRTELGTAVRTLVLHR